MDGWEDGWMDGWLAGWMDGGMHRGRERGEEGGGSGWGWGGRGTNIRLGSQLQYTPVRHGQRLGFLWLCSVLGLDYFRTSMIPYFS